MTTRLQACQQALDLTCQMLELARQEAWDALGPLQETREQVLQALSDIAPAEDAEEAVCLRTLLLHQSELTQRVAQRQEDLSRQLNTHKAGRLMSQVYGQVSGRKELL